MNLIVIDDNADILLEFRIILKRDSEYKKVKSRKKRRTTISSERTRVARTQSRACVYFEAYSRKDHRMARDENREMQL